MKAEKSIFRGIERYIFISKITLEANSTPTNLISTAHLAAVGDIVVLTSGPFLNSSFNVVTVVDANTIAINPNLPCNAAVGMTANVYRRVPKTGEADAWVYNSAADITDLTPVEAKAAVANKRHVITKVVGSNSDTTEGTVVQLLSAGTVLAQYPNAADYGGFKDDCFEEPIKCAINEALNVACLTTSSQTRVTIWGATI